MSSTTFIEGRTREEVIAAVKESLRKKREWEKRAQENLRRIQRESDEIAEDL